MTARSDQALSFPLEPGVGAMAEPAVPMDGPWGFDGFLDQHREALVRFLRTRLPSEEDAQDAAQESLVRLMRYRGSASPREWKPLLYRIAVNVAYSQQRQALTHHDAAHVPYEESLAHLPAPSPAPDEQAARQQALARIGRIIRGLSPRCQEVYVLNRIEGMSYSQIADYCGISPKAVEKQMTKALGILRERLGGDWDPEAL